MAEITTNTTGPGGTLAGKVALVTGGGRRIGAAIVARLHGEGMHIVLHYHRSGADATSLRDRLNAGRPGSCRALCADLRRVAEIRRLVQDAVAAFGRLDAVINNASGYYATPLEELAEPVYEDLMGTNFKAPLFLAHAARAQLLACRGAIVNISDLYAQKPRSGYAVYCAAKAALESLTRSLAAELGPRVRVNAVAPGAILWPGQGGSAPEAEIIVDATALKRTGDPSDIAGAVAFLLRDGGFITGQVLRVDGGRLG